MKDARFKLMALALTAGIIALGAAKYLGPPAQASSPAADYRAGLTMTGENKEPYEKPRRLFYDQRRNFPQEFMPPPGR
jgi:hypothetical protein